MRHALFVAVLLTAAATANAQGLSVTTDGFEEGVNAGLRQGEDLRRQREAEREAARRATEARSEGSGHGRLSCDSLYKDYQLQQYCRTGNCEFYDDYALNQLCKNDDPSGYGGNYKVYQYLKTGDYYGFSDYTAQQNAKRFSSSFSERKLFTIYYLRGYEFQ